MNGNDDLKSQVRVIDGNGHQEIDAKDELSSLSSLPYAEAKRLAIRTFERSYLSALLEKHQHNISSAARAAGVDRSNFRRLLKQYEVAARSSQRPSAQVAAPDTVRNSA